MGFFQKLFFGEHDIQKQKSKVSSKNFTLKALVRDLNKIGVKTKIIDEFERICRQYPDSAAIGLDDMRGMISGVKKKPNVDKMTITFLESALVAHLTKIVEHATGKMPNLRSLLI